MIDDVDRIMAVMEAAFDPAYGEAWTRRQIADALLVPGTHYVLIADGGSAPGEGEPAAGFALTRGAADEEELLLIAVLPLLRRKGLGSALLGRVISQARARGTARLFLEMREGNPAEALYRRHGFMPVGRRRNYYRRANHGALDAITFRLETP